MASDTDDAGGSGCLQKGAGCLKWAGIILGGLLVWAFVQSFFSWYPLAAWGIVISGGLFVGGCVVGGIVGSSVLEGTTRRRVRSAGPIVLGFGIACLLAVVGMTLKPSRFQFEAEASAEGGMLGPVEVPYEDMRVDVQVRQSIAAGSGRRYQRWSFVTIELLDADKEYLSSFGGEFWHYAGYDDGYWNEEDTEYETMLQFPSPGTYYLQLQTDANVGMDELRPITVEMHERAWWGNPIPVRYAAFVAFFLGGILIVAPRVGRSAMVKQHLEDGGEVRYDGQTWRVGGELRCTYDDWQATEWSLQPTDPGAKMPRYLEHEYEVDSNWENWLMSKPIGLDDLTCPDSDGGETTVQEFVERHGELPDAVRAEGRRYALDDRGTVRREGASVRYHNYDGGGGDFVTIEGTPGESLEAVVGGKISVSELTVVEEA